MKPKKIGKIELCEMIEPNRKHTCKRTEMKYSTFNICKYVYDIKIFKWAYKLLIKQMPKSQREMNGQAKGKKGMREWIDSSEITMAFPLIRSRTHFWWHLNEINKYINNESKGGVAGRTQQLSFHELCDDSEENQWLNCAFINS